MWLPATLLLMVSSYCINAQISRNLAEVAEEEGLFNFLDYIKKAGLLNTLSTGGPFTVFVPVNSAFKTLKPSFKARLENDRQVLRKFLFHHFVHGNILSSSLHDKRQLNSMVESLLTVRSGAGGITVKDARILRSNLTASNGVIHMIGDVLLPEQITTLLDVAEEEPELSMFSAYIKQGNLEDTLSNGGAFTVFAPTNDAFRGLAKDFVYKMKSDPQILRSLLLYHILPQKYPTRRITNGMTVSSVEGRNLRFRTNTNRGNVTVNGVEIVKADMNATNGIIHVIQEILIPPSLKQDAEMNLMQVAERGGFSMMMELITMAGLQDTLAYGGPYTLFAPHDSVLSQVDQETLLQLQVNPEILELVLLHHVVPGATYSSDFYDGLQKDTLGGQNLTFTVSPSKITVNEGAVIDPNIIAANGVIHGIDTLLVPSGSHLLKRGIRDLEKEANRQGLTILVELIKKADLHLLSTPEPYTLFAPTNEAFASLSASTLQKISNDKELIRNVLLYHIVSGRVGSNDLRNDLLASSIKGDLLRINVYPKENSIDQIYTVNGAKITESDILASNGVLHIIDKVVLTPAGDISKILARDPRLSTLNRAVTSAGMMDVLKSNGPLTVFAPTNDAFDAIGSDTMAQLLGDKEALTELLLRHIIPGNNAGTMYSTGLCWNNLLTATNQVVKTGMGSNGVVLASDYASSTVVEADISATNGVVHIIDSVI